MKNVAIIGCGRVSEHYIFIIKKFKYKKFRVVAVCDKNINKAKRISNKLKCNYYSNFSQMILNEDIDFIFVLTPSSDHFKSSFMAIKNNISVICEKPISMNSKDGKKLVNYAKKKGVKFYVCYQNRFNKSVVFLKKLIKSKKLGKIISFSVRVRWCRFQEYFEDGWHGTWKHDGGVINQQAIHHLDCLNVTLGPIKEVFARMTNRLNKLQAEDTMVCSLKLNNGATGTFESTTAARPKDIEASISILGSNGYIEVGGIAMNKVNKLLVKNKNYKKKYLNTISENVINGYGWSHKRVFDHVFSNKKENLKTSDTHNKYSIETTKIVHSIYKSCETNRNIILKKNNVSKKLGK